MDLKEALGEELYNQVTEKLKGNDKIKLANLADGGYVGKEKFDASETTITDLTKQLNDLQTKYKTDTEALQNKINQNALSAALDLGITKAKGKNAKAVKALLDTSKMSLKDDGTVDGLDAALDTLKKSDGYLFEQVETKPEGNGFHSGTPSPDSPEAKQVADAFAAARGNF